MGGVPVYPGLLERRRCEERTQKELREFPPRSPLSFRDELRLRGMHGKCATCRACPARNQLAAWMPADPEASSAVILKLAV